MKNEFQPDDPRLTAYALGELEPEETAAIETALQANPELRATVDDIRATAAQIEAALESETIAAADAATPAAPAPAIPLAASPSRMDEYAPVNGRSHRSGLGRFLRFPHLYYIVGGLAAACFAVLVVFHEPPATVVKRTYQVIDLRGGNGATAAPVELPAVVSPPSVAAKEESRAPAGLALLNQVQPPPQADLKLALPAVDFGGLPLGQNERGVLLAQSDGAAQATGAVTVPNSSANGGLISAPAKKTRGSGGERWSFSATALAPSSPTDLFPGPRSRLSVAEPAPPGPPRVTHNTEGYTYVRDNDFLSAIQNPLSTFSIDVDTASYANIRRFLLAGRLPPPDAVRIEELINYFPFRYAAPANTSADAVPFAASMEVADAPWAPTHRLVRIGLKGRDVTTEARPAANLVFLLDVSGSMDQPNKLPLVKESMRLLLGKLRRDDRVAIVTYAGNSGLALPSTPVAQSREILDALDALRAGGSTNGAMGIQLAYDIAKANFVKDGVNRVILCTDGDFNVGVTSQGELVRLVDEKAKSGVFLTVLGFGMGNLKDATLELLADKGNGNYGYIDTQREAEKRLVEQVSGTLVTIAKDVKIQVDFNPAKVASYRLIGYENRLLKQEDFNNDKVDAGEIGAGHTVTALYEVIPAGAAENAAGSDVQESKYVPRFAPPKLPAAIADELLTVRVRYKEPAGEVSRKLEFPLKDDGGDFASASADFKFTSALAAFGMILRDSPHKGRATIGNVIEWAAAGASSAVDDPRGYRGEFLDLARRAQTLLGK